MSGTMRMFVALGLGLCLVAAAKADVKPHALCSDGMVLQQKTKAQIWGKADPGERVTVQFRGATVQGAADKDGVWKLAVATGEAGGPFPLTIEGKNKVELKDVLVGEVWVCSGQSNMEWTINMSSKEEQAAVKALPANPRLRMFKVAKTPRDEPAFDCAGKWESASPETVGNMSAVGYFFGRSLNEKLNVPVGMINTSWGGTRAEAWTRRSVLDADPVQKAGLAQYDQQMARQAKNYDEAVKKYKEDAAKAKAEGKTPPRPPVNPANNPNAPSVLYNGMIAPILPYAIAGAIWYQGESNAGKAFEYRDLFPMMIRNWRQDWGRGDIPFYFVQLAPFGAVKKEPGDSAWAELREAQYLTLKRLPATGMAVIMDVGHEADIHPTPKQPVGERLARIARANVYGEKIEFSGPTLADVRYEGNKAILRFQNTAGGLESRELVAADERKDPMGKPRGSAWRVKEGSAGAPLMGFTIAGEDRVFHNAQARIEGDTVVVWCDQVAKPVAVRYGWSDHPLVNLFNREGLPASPFRTDEFPGVTQGK